MTIDIGAVKFACGELWEKQKEDISDLHAGILVCAYLENSKKEQAKTNICNEILSIMQTYNEQLERMGHIGTPGGLEHMGDVWQLFSEWERELLS